ncbi:MAG TPA: S8 family serine peptidase [Candidatus Thalassarchaeaceae archaeon]|nr:S8 family serine peptidase [Candidatus Thalassarchaeaceae archaeon]
MRGTVSTLTALMLLSLLAPITASQPMIPQSEEVFHTYSGAVQRAFFQVEAFENSISEEPPEQWLVLTTLIPEIIDPWIDSGIEIKKAPFLEGAWIWKFENPSNAPNILANLEDDGLIERSLPERLRQHQPRAVLNDPELGSQWHLNNTGQGGGTIGEDANVSAAWDIVDGSGVTIAIIDDGFAHTHNDLSPGYQSSHSYDYCNNDADPTPSSGNGHGTSAAGVAGGRGNNNYGVAGAAYGADLSGLLLIACGTPDSNEASALSHDDQDNDIYSNSWGPPDTGNYKMEWTAGPLVIAAFESDFSTGRGGLGNIITWAGGNGLANNDNSNYDGYANVRQTISIGAITNSGTQSWYSEPGANILVVAHSNGGSLGIHTTDIPGSGGYNNSGDINPSFGGTSSATPLVSGVVGLILDVDPTLTARDVMGILANSARKNDAGDSSWSTNAAGHDISHKYGFGAVDAHAAVTLAANWTKLQSETSFGTSISSPGTSIPDNGAPVTDTITVNRDLKIEHVNIVVNITHTGRGDLETILTSPDGTESILTEKHGDSGDHYTAWSFGSERHLDEYALGDWTLSIEDKANGDTGTFVDWHLEFYGVDEYRDSDGDGLTDVNETNIHNTNPSLADTDGDGLNDGDEILNESTDPNNSDSDGDGLDDGTEVLVHSTNPNLQDTDGDGLTDGEEVLIHGSDPLVVDVDADSDFYYWFGDCDDNDPNINPGRPELLNGIDDDCDLLVDEGFEILDSDGDGLTDHAEYHSHTTDPNNSDTDGDGLSDGDEVLVHSTDPLVVDQDGDSDGYYWFQDCEDNNASIHPNAIEILDGIDQDCDTEIDETFLTVDSDNDGLYDYDEFHVYGTGVNNSDTDNDSLTDGEEVNIHSTDPLTPEVDADSDGVLWLFDCNDGNSTIYPGATELWNGIDDDCDSIVDENVDRQAALTLHPNSNFFEHVITNNSMSLSWSGAPNGVELNETWYRDSQNLNVTSSELNVAQIDCNDPLDEFESTACVQGRITVVYILHLEDSNGIIELSWAVRLIAESPPEPEPEPEPEPIDDEEEKEDDANTDSGQDDYNSLNELPIPKETLFIIFGILIVMLIVMLMVRISKPPREVKAWSPPPIHERRKISMYDNQVPNAPNFNDRRR